MSKIQSSYSEPSLTCLKVPHQDPGVHSAIIHRLLIHFAQISPAQEIVVVCIGTDRSTGDCLGPLVGTSLSKHRNPYYHLYGTLDEPVHAMNLEDTLQQINHKFVNPFIIGIDACLGQSSSVGSIQVVRAPYALELG